MIFLIFAQKHRLLAEIRKISVLSESFSFGGEIFYIFEQACFCYNIFLSFSQKIGFGISGSFHELSKPIFWEK